MPDILRKLQQHHPNLVVIDEIIATGNAMANRFYQRPQVVSDHACLVKSAGIKPEQAAVFAQQPLHRISAGGDNIADGANALFGQLALGSAPNKKQLVGRQLPNHLPKIILVDHSHRVGLTQIRSQLGKNFIERNTDTDRQSQLTAYGLTDIFRDLPARTEQPLAVRHIEPTFVDTKRLYLVGVTLINLPRQPRILEILFKLWRHYDQTRAALFCLPINHAGFDAGFFGRLGFGQHYAVAILATAANRHRLAAQLGVEHHLHRSIKAVQITVQYQPLTGHPPPLPFAKKSMLDKSANRKYYEFAFLIFRNYLSSFRKGCQEATMKFYEVFCLKGNADMNSFADKVRNARETIGMSQTALATAVGVSQRSITAYETGNAKPRGVTARKLARALQVSLDYLLNDEIDDPQYGMEQEAWLQNIEAVYGARGEAEAKALLEKNLALFAGGTLSQQAKDAFFEAVMTAYVTCKEQARKIYSPKQDD